MARRSALRASDLDREHVAERLRDATAEGRLLAEELEERVGAALSARTYGELDVLVADLPVVRERRRATAPLAVRATILVAVAMAVVATLALVTLVLLGLAGAWLGWMVFAWLFFGRRGWRGRCVGGSRSRAVAYRSGTGRTRPPRSGPATLL
jgi:hypothetical protein